MAGIDYGPDVPTDNFFTRRMRFHQSWWRHHRLGAMIGIGPGPNSDRPLGNCLANEAAHAGKNFLTPGIHAYAEERINQGGGVERFRCTHNLLSSQPMAFNLFGPLHLDRALADQLLDVLLPHGATGSDVKVEWAPEPAACYLGDRTSCDAVAHHHTRDGRPAITAFETKLTEPFSRSKDDKPRYREVAAAASVWLDPDHKTFRTPAVNQLWRNQLLIEAIRQQPDADPELLGCCAVVHHPEDDRCAEDIATYQALLRDGTTLLDLRLDHIVATWKPLVLGTQYEQWLLDFEDRYLKLGLSDEAWEKRQ